MQRYECKWAVLAAVVVGVGAMALVSRNKKRRRSGLVGVIGGLGPKATAVWYDDNVLKGRVKLFQAMQAAKSKDCPFKEEVMKVCAAKWTESELVHVWSRRFGDEKLRDQDHISILMYSNPTIPGRPEFMSGQSTVDPTAEMARTVKALESGGASAICMVCSTAHYFKNGMLADSDIPFIDMIELSIEYIVDALSLDREPPSGSVRVGILGTEPLLKFGVYEKVCREKFGHCNIELVSPFNVPEGEQGNFTEAIFGIHGIKAGYDTDFSCHHTFRNFNLLLEELVKLWRAGAQAIILGCTELPLVLSKESLRTHGPPGIETLLLVNPAQILADEVIRFSLVQRSEGLSRP